MYTQHAMPLEYNKVNYGDSCNELFSGGLGSLDMHLAQKSIGILQCLISQEALLQYTDVSTKLAAYYDFTKITASDIKSFRFNVAGTSIMVANGGLFDSDRNI
jgi:hypothetical protein